MANTKRMKRENRKAKKRQARRTLKAKVAALSTKEAKQLRKFEGTTTAFLRKLETEKASAGSGGDASAS